MKSNKCITSLFTMIIALCVFTVMLSVPAFADGIAGIYGLTSTNAAVRILENEIAVFSDSASPVSSSTAVGAINTSGEWSVSGWSASDGGSISSTASVTGGYFVLTNGASNVYIPVVVRGEDLFVDGMPSDAVSKENINPNSVIMGIEACVGGKDENELSYVIRADENAMNTDGGIRFRQSFAVFTYAFNLYAEGDVTAKVSFCANQGADIPIFSYKPDGSYEYYTNATAQSIGEGELTRKQWHRIAISLDVKRGRFHIYVNGKKMTNSAGGIWGASTVGLSLTLSKGSKNGFVAVSDADAYYGFYNETIEPISFSVLSDEVVLKDEKLYVNTESINDVDSLFSAIETDAGYKKVFADSSFKDSPLSFENGAILVLANDAHNAYKYYELMPSQIQVNNVNFVRNGDSISVSADVDYNSNTQKDIVMILILKDNDGYIRKVMSSDTVSVSKTPSAIELVCDGVNGLSAELFFINNWTDRYGYFYSIYTENGALNN